MFQVGDRVMHSRDGVCDIVDIRTEEFVKEHPREYYLLRPLGASAEMTIYLPIDQTKVRLRYVMTAEEADELVKRAVESEPIWTGSEQERHERVTRVLRDCEPISMMRLVQDLREEQSKRRMLGKKLRYTDENALQEAVRLLRQEMAAARGVSPSEVVI